MPLLDNPKHEIFAQELAKGSSQAAAYKTAGYKPSVPHASRLATNGKVFARVSEILDRAVEKTEVTVESLIREADAIRRAAMASGQYSAATSALISKAKLAGLWVKKTDNTNTNRNVDPNSLSDEEIVDIIARGSEDIAEASGSSVPAPIHAWRRKVA